MKSTILKISSVLCGICVLISAFATYVCFVKSTRAEQWMSTYEEYSQYMDVSKYDFLGTNVYEMEEIISKSQGDKTCGLIITVVLLLTSVICGLLHLKITKSKQPHSTTQKFKFKNIIPRLLMALGIIGTNVGAYVLYYKYILFPTPDEKIQNALDYLYSPMSEYETTQSETETLFYFLIGLIVVSVLLFIVSTIINHINRRKQQNELEI